MISRSTLQAERWQTLGGIVIDVMAMLENLSRQTNPHDKTLTPAQERSLRTLKAAMLTAVHALRPVIEEMNHESLYWKFLTPTQWDKDAALVTKALHKLPVFKDDEL